MTVIDSQHKGCGMLIVPEFTEYKLKNLIGSGRRMFAVSHHFCDFPQSVLAGVCLIRQSLVFSEDLCQIAMRFYSLVQCSS